MFDFDQLLAVCVVAHTMGRKIYPLTPVHLIQISFLIEFIHF